MLVLALGSAVGFRDQPALIQGAELRIAAPWMRTWDMEVPVSVSRGEIESVDRLAGRVRLRSPERASISGAFLPTVPVLEAQRYSLFIGGYAETAARFGHQLQARKPTGSTYSGRLTISRTLMTGFGEALGRIVVLEMPSGERTIRIWAELDVSDLDAFLRGEGKEIGWTGKPDKDRRIATIV